DKKAEKIIENLEKKAIKMELPPEKDKEYELKLEEEIQDTIIPNPFIKSNLKMKDFTLKKKNIVKTSKVEFKKKIELIKRKLIMKKQQYLSNISFGGKFRYKSGDKGTTLLHVYTPFVKGELFFNQYSYIYYGAYYPFITSRGAPNYNEFGMVQYPVIRETNTNGSGLEPFIGYVSRKSFILKGEISFTPIGNTPVNPELLANFGLGKRFNQNKFYLEVGRYVEKNSLLSYIGSKDPHSKNVWGRVLETRFSLDYERSLDKKDSLIFSSIRYSTLKGKNTNENKKLDLIFLPKFYLGKNILSQDYLGIYLQFMSYRKDEDLFYFGNGGYFSPKTYFMLAPVYEGFYFSKRGDLGIQLKLMTGILKINTSKYNQTTLAFDIFLGGEKLLSNKYSLKGGIELRKTTSYTEIFSLLSLNYYFGIKSFIRKQDLLKIEREVIR
ncbi:MAG TPA: hypothetical protein EYP82_07365, partial [Hydrogenothermaceae bacterium]|nr:hypothetical protein [Hydrogenothermaceae bacterium]